MHQEDQGVDAKAEALQVMDCWVGAQHAAGQGVVVIVGVLLVPMGCWRARQQEGQGAVVLLGVWQARQEEAQGVDVIVGVWLEKGCQEGGRHVVDQGVVVIARAPYAKDC